MIKDPYLNEDVAIGSHGGGQYTFPSGRSGVLGGTGDDTYVVPAGSIAVIRDLGGSDAVVAPGMAYATTSAGVVDDRHLWITDSSTGTTVIVADWTASPNIIEQWQADRTYTHADLLALQGQGTDVAFYPSEPLSQAVADLNRSGYDYELAEMQGFVDWFTSITIETAGGTPPAGPGTGSGGARTLTGTAGDDDLAGTAGADTFLLGQGGFDRVDGGGGLDTVEIPGTAAGIEVSVGGDGVVTLDAAGGSATLTDVERVRFDDLSVAFDTVAEQAYRVYQAAFARTPDAEGLGYWIEQMTNGAPLATVAQAFMESQEFQQAYGSVGGEGFVTLLYQNVLGRAPDDDGMAYWLNAMAAGTSRAEVLVHFSESGENQSAVAASIADGVWFA